MKRIILDTNFLLIPSQFNVDVFSQIKKLMTVPYELHVLDETVKELEKIKEEQKGKSRDAAKLGLQLIEGRVKVITTTGGHADDIIVAVADKDTIVATQDQGLKRRLKEKDIQIIYLRQKKHLQLQ